MKTAIAFDSAGLTIAGHLYKPDDETTAPRPAIVVGHPGSGVKEQAAGLYAEQLAARGFITLAFDAAYQGESEGEPRGLEDPSQRVEDVKAAVSALVIHPEVDADRIGVLGICASGGYVVSAAATDHRIKAVAGVSAVDIARQFREGPDGAQDPAVIQGMLDAAAAARTAQARGEGVQTFQLFPDTAEEARALGRHALDGYEYYCTDRAQHPRSTKHMPWRSVDLIAAFDAFRFVGLIAPRPVLMIAGRQAVTTHMTTQAISQAQGPKELFWIEGASHVDLYDKPQYVTPAVAKLADFFRTALSDHLEALISAG